MIDWNGLFSKLFLVSPIIFGGISFSLGMRAASKGSSSEHKSDVIAAMTAVVLPIGFYLLIAILNRFVRSGYFDRNNLVAVAVTLLNIPVNLISLYFGMKEGERGTRA